MEKGEGPATWGICPGCARERRINARGYMVKHNRYEHAEHKMVYCRGSSGQPLYPTMWHQKRTKNVK